MTQGLQTTDDAPRAALLAYTWQAAVVGLTGGISRILAAVGVYVSWGDGIFSNPEVVCVCDKVVCVRELCVTELCVKELCVRELCVREGGGRTGADGSAQQKNKNPTQRYGVKSVPSLSAFGDCLDIWNPISSDESCWSALISHQHCKQKMCVSHLKTNPFLAFPGFFKTNLMYQLDGRGG